MRILPANPIKTSQMWRKNSKSGNTAEKAVFRPTPYRTHTARVAVVALVVTSVVDICCECRTGRPREGICHPLKVMSMAHRLTSLNNKIMKGNFN